MVFLPLMRMLCSQDLRQRRRDEGLTSRVIRKQNKSTPRCWLLVVLACSGVALSAPLGGAPDTIFVNGDVVTMDAEANVVEAVAVRAGRIVRTGNASDLLALRGAATQVIDLGGKALLPGFIDSHSHVSMVAAKLAAADLSPEPAGNVASIAGIEAALLRHLDENPSTRDDWLIGWGYDHSMLAENRHPTRVDLDRIATDIPIVVVHFSGHQAVLNSPGLVRAGYGSDTPDPPGGVIRREPGSNEPNGIIEEQAWLPIWKEILNPALETKIDLHARALGIYVAQGFTTVQDGGTMDPETVAIFGTLARRHLLPVDVIAFPYEPLMPQFESDLAEYRVYRNRFRFGGVKLVLDGGTPGRTAFLREPYFVQMQGESGYRGYPQFNDQGAIDRRVEKYCRRNLPVNIHALGDAAIDQAIAALRHAEQACPEGDRRTNLIHLQVLREDQLDALRRLDATLTFQVAHNHYFGDLHREWTLGPQRAANLNPARSAVQRGIPFTIHHDAPIHPVDQLTLIWAAVNRVTRSGAVLGPDQRISVLDALRASTINAAYQYFEEDRKGSIEAGKLADLVVLSANPLQVHPMTLKDLQVLATYKEGHEVFRKPR